MKYQIDFIINRIPKVEDGCSLCPVAGNWILSEESASVACAGTSPVLYQCSSPGHGIQTVLHYLPPASSHLALNEFRWPSATCRWFPWLPMTFRFFSCRFLVLNKISLLFCAGLKKVRTSDGAFVSRNVLHFVPSIKGPQQSSLLERFISLVKDFRISTFDLTLYNQSDCAQKEQFEHLWLTKIYKITTANIFFNVTSLKELNILYVDSRGSGWNGNQGVWIKSLFLTDIYFDVIAKYHSIQQWA